MPTSQPDRTVIPLAEPKFEGTIGETYKDSTAAWPKLPAPPAGAPNVVVIMLDDVGFGQTSTFGGPIPTPELDKLAMQGLRYTRFHTTAICGPSRAALITGRNHHNAGSGFLAEWATGFPSYNNMIPKTTASVAATLKGNGYATSWFGKNHNTPDWESSVAGPFDRWPTGMTAFQYPFQVSTSSNEGSMKFSSISPWAIRSMMASKRKGLWGARWQVSADQRLRPLSVLRRENFFRYSSTDI